MEYYCENYDSLTTEMRGDSRKLNGGEWQLNQYLQSPCFQSKNLCFRPVKNGWFRPRKKVLSLKVFDWTLCWSLQKLLNFHSEDPEVEFSRHCLFFSVIKHAGFEKLQGLVYWECQLWMLIASCGSYEGECHGDAKYV